MAQERPSPRKDPMVKLWVSDNRNVLTQIAQEYKVSPQFVHLVLYGKRKSLNRRIEYALKERGAPIHIYE